MTPGHNLLDLDGVSKRYGGLQVLDEVSLGIESGEMVGLIGPNGAGKSTLFGLISGAVSPTAGRIRWDGADVTGWSPERAAAAGVGRTYQIMRVFKSMSVLENVMVGAYLRERSPRSARRLAEEVLERVQLAGDAERPAASLTVASKKRLEMARMLATGPRLLLLDEVMSGLTPVETQTAVEIVRSLNEDGLTIVLVEHVMEVVMPLSRRLVVLDHGVKIADGPPERVSRDASVIRAYLGGN